MKTKVIIAQFATLILILMIQSSCLNAQKIKSFSTSNEDTIKGVIEQYHPQVIAVIKKGMIEGKESLRSHFVDLQSEYGTPQKFKSNFTVAVHKSLTYEIGSLQFNENDKFAQLSIWDSKNDQRQKIFEVMYKDKGTKELPEGIAKAREKWMKLCNEHNAQKLVNELYTIDAIYFNRGRILKGQKDLVREYSYMNSPNYNLQLTPKHIEVVDDETAFEIGQCSGSYNLPYMLVWKKQENNSWKIYLDSNY